LSVITLIKPSRKLSIDFNELKQYRELFYYFAWRDIKVRYKQTAIGAAWAIFQPFITMIVFTLFFNKVAGISTGGAVPYAIFSYTGLLFWQYFSNALNRSSNSLVENQSVITKVYFPRIIPPISATIVALIDFFFATLVFAGLMIYFRITPGLDGILLLPPAIIITFIAATGIGMYLAALNVKYRDVKQALPFFIQIGLFLTPVIYPVTKVPEAYQWLLYLNPMTGVITAMRSSLLGLGTIDWPLTLLSVASALVLFVFGIFYFKAKEREFADII
jgi:lipopolysaccharide transport system permease protein